MMNQNPNRIPAMMLLAIKDYIKCHPRVSILELSRKFNIDSGHLRIMLERWISKGHISRYLPENKCNSNVCSCSSCIISELELYTWQY